MSRTIGIGQEYSSDPSYASKRRYADKFKVLRQELIQSISNGAGCNICGSFKNLEIDHCDGRSYVLNKLSSVQRVKKYIEEYQKGVALRVLCRRCNAKSGGGLRYDSSRKDEFDADDPLANPSDDLSDVPF